MLTFRHFPGGVGGVREGLVRRPVTVTPLLPAAPGPPRGLIWPQHEQLEACPHPHWSPRLFSLSLVLEYVVWGRQGA